MCLDQMSSSECAAEAEFSGENTRCNDPSQLAGVVSRIGWVRALDTKEIEHGALGLKDRTATKGPYFYARHGHADLQVTVVARITVSVWHTASNVGMDLLPHHGDAVATFHILGRVLAGR